MNDVATIEINDLRGERDRFVAFALAAADALVETDRDFNIRYAAGAVRWVFGHEVAEDGTVNLQDSVTPNYSKLFDAACKLGKKEGRFGALNMVFERSRGSPVTAQLSGTYLPIEGGRYYFAMRGRAPEMGQKSETKAPGKVIKQNSKTLAKSVSKVAGQARQDGRDVDLTLLNLSGLEALRSRLEPDKAAEMMADVEAQLNTRSLGGSMVTQVSKETYSVIHDHNMNAEGLAQDISECAAGYDDEGEGISVQASTIDITTTQLTEAEMAKALVYAIQKFTESQGEYTVSDLNEGYMDVLESAGKKITSIKELIKLRAFDLAYQPIVGLVDGGIHHHEALVRFRGDGKNASPYETITFAEDVGLIAALDLAICERAVDTVKEANNGGGDLSLAVNVSGKSLETPVFLERLKNLLKDCHNIRDELLFEVTESSKITNLEATNNFLQSVRDLGHKVCLDDFGAGASAFQYLRALSVDFVKIDGSYVRDIVDDEEKQAFVRSMVSLCKDLDIETVAEMIEDEATVEILKALDVDYGQGYLFGRPEIPT